MERAQDLSFKGWLLFVFVLHSLMISTAAFFSAPSPPPMPKKVKVQTVKLSQAAIKPEKTQNSKPLPKKQEAALEKTPPKKQQVKKPTPTKTAKAQEKPTPKKTSKVEDKPKASSQPTNSNKQAALDRLKSVNAQAPLSSSKKEPLATIAIADAIQTDGLELSLYQTLLVAKLKSELKLPEKGFVEVKLTIKSNGHIKEVHVGKSSSKKNEDYVRQKLPKLQFDPFGKEFSNESEHVFHLELTHSGL